MVQQEMLHMQAEVQTSRQQMDAAQQTVTVQPTTEAFSLLIHRRMLTKPRSFSGRGDERSIFAPMTRAYCGALDPRLCTEMETAALVTGGVLKAAMPPDQKHRSPVHRYLPVRLMDARALMIAENGKSGNGSESGENSWTRTSQRWVRELQAF